MGVVRFFILSLGVALVAAGCAPRPVGYMTYPSPAVTGPSHGIDSVVYGVGGPYVPPPIAAPAPIAGGFTPRAFRRTLIVNRTINGHAMRMTVPVTFPLHPGGTVNVQERWF